MVYLNTFSTTQELGQAAAAYVSTLSAQAIAARGRFTVALSGGSLPRILGPALTAEPQRAQIDWPRWHIFWADERCLPLTDPESNYAVARQYIFEHVNIPPTQIYPVDDTLAPAAAARAYQDTLAQVFQPDSGQLPSFDLILLGMGEDGHTASLFPGHPLLHERERWVTPIFDSPKPPPARVTLTLPVLNHARQVIFITAGTSKATALAQIFKKMTSPARLPAQMVQPVNGEVHWFVDKAAASLSQ